MSRSLTILDADYKSWVKELSQRYRRSQIKAAVKVNYNPNIYINRTDNIHDFDIDRKNLLFN